MNARIVSGLPVGEAAWLFDRADISVIQITDGGDFIRLRHDGWNRLDVAVDEVQSWMVGSKHPLYWLLAMLDKAPVRNRRKFHLPRYGPGTPSDACLAAITNHPHSPFGIQYQWGSGVVPAWPSGMTLVLFRGRSTSATATLS